jgi:ribosomal-protein-alanine N-acetyltransferase
VSELLRVQPELERALFDFEVDNREYFSGFINDRGDEFFENFSEQFRELLAEQDTGNFAFLVLVDEGGALVGRFNLFDIGEGGADVGYRVAGHAAGRGVATEGLRSLCRVARDDYALARLRAVVSHDNVASCRVLEKVGFVPIGAGTAGGRDGTVFELDLTRQS